MFEDPSLPNAHDDLDRTPAENRERKQQFSRVLNITALLYAFLHKFFVPLVLFALDGKTEFRVIDWWWVYHAVLAIALKRKDWNDIFLQAILGFGFGGLVVQSYDGLMAQGWHSFSLWLTTLTSGAVLVYVTTLMPAFSKRSLGSWGAGFFMGLLMMGTLTFWLGMDRYALKTQSNQAAISEFVPKLGKAASCGTQKISLSLKADSIILPEDTQTSNRFIVKACGFSVALQKVDPTQKIEFANEGLEFLNIRLNHLVGKRWQPLSNRPLRPGETLQIDFHDTATEGLWIIESDARPQAGLIVLYSDVNSLLNKLKSFSLSDSVIFSREGIAGSH